MTKQVSSDELKKFALENSWKAGMDKSRGLDGWSNYSGGMEKPDWVVVVGRNRDSDILSESNFASALEMLGGEGKNVEIARFGHWGCGWFELILVNPKSMKSLKVAYEIEKSLADYPVLNEYDYHEREHEYRSEYAEQAKKDLAEALSKHFSLKLNKGLISLAYDLNMVCQSYYGNDDCVNVYENRPIEKRDMEQLITCMRQVCGYDKNRAFQALKKAIISKGYEV
jgi:hypothetical protein